MNFFNTFGLLTDALSGACAGSLFEKKNTICGRKKLGMWDSISRPLPRYAKVLPLALFGQTPSNVHIKINHIEKIIKIEITNNSNI